MDYTLLQKIQQKNLVKQKKFKELKKEHDEFFAKFNEKIANKKKPKVLVLMGLPGSYMAATEKSYVGNLVKLAGGENIIKGTEEFKKSKHRNCFK